MSRFDTISLQALNGWRGPGALAIAFGHFAVATHTLPREAVAPLALLVDLFFVLSGILIAQVYMDQLKGPSALVQYGIRRLGRIWPVQAAMLGILVAYELMKLLAQHVAGAQFSIPAFAPDGANFVQAIPTNLLLIHSLGVHDRETWDFPSWSLSVEFVTYLFFAAVCLFQPKLRRIACVLIVIASIAALVTLAPAHMRSTYDYGIFRCLAGFFAGVLLLEALRHWGVRSFPLATVAELLAIAAIILWMRHAGAQGLAYFAPILFCLAVLPFISARGLLSKLLLTKPFQILAELSFAIYMVHAVVLMLLLAFLHGYERATHRPLFVTAPNPLSPEPGWTPTIQILHLGSPFALSLLIALYLTAVLVAAMLTYRFVETPGRVFFNALAKRIGRALEHKTQIAPIGRPMGDQL